MNSIQQSGKIFSHRQHIQQLKQTATQAKQKLLVKFRAYKWSLVGFFVFGAVSLATTSAFSNHATTPTYQNTVQPALQANSPEVQSIQTEIQRAQQALKEQEQQCAHQRDELQAQMQNISEQERAVFEQNMQRQVQGCTDWVQQTRNYIDALNSRLQQVQNQFTAQPTPQPRQPNNNYANPYTPPTDIPSNPDPAMRGVYAEWQRAQQALREQQNTCNQQPPANAQPCQAWMQKTIDYIRQLEQQLRQHGQAISPTPAVGSPNAQWTTNHWPRPTSWPSPTPTSNPYQPISNHMSFCQQFNLNEEQCIAVWIYCELRGQGPRIMETPGGKSVIDERNGQQKDLRQYMKEKYPDKPWEKMQKVRT